MAVQSYETGRPATQESRIQPINSVKSAVETLINAIGELQKTYDELRNRLGAVIEASPVVASAGDNVPMPARLPPTACQLSCAIDCEAERIEKMAGEMYRLTQSIQL